MSELLETALECVGNGNRVLRVSVQTQRGELTQFYWVELFRRAGAVVPFKAILQRFGYNSDGSLTEYTVDLQSGACSCPDAKYRPKADGCKHSQALRAQLVKS